MKTATDTATFLGFSFAFILRGWGRFHILCQKNKHNNNREIKFRLIENPLLCSWFSLTHAYYLTFIYHGTVLKIVFYSWLNWSWSLIWTGICLVPVWLVVRLSQSFVILYDVSARYEGVDHYKIWRNRQELKKRVLKKCSLMINGETRNPRNLYTADSALLKRHRNVILQIVTLL